MTTTSRGSVELLADAGFKFEYWLPFFLATPFFVWMARRFRFEPGAYRRSLVAHVVGGVAFALVQPPVYSGVVNLTMDLMRTTGGEHARADGAEPQLPSAEGVQGGDEPRIRCRDDDRVDMSMPWSEHHEPAADDW